MSDLLSLAARLWKAEAEDAGAPASLVERRTLEAFMDEHDTTRARWEKIAKAALDHIAAAPAPQPAQAGAFLPVLLLKQIGDALAQAGGTALGVAMSTEHPDPGGALTDVFHACNDTALALQKALVAAPAGAPAPQPAQEPYVWVREYPATFDPYYGGEPSSTEFLDAPEKGAIPLYAAPPTYEQGVADGLRRAVEPLKDVLAHLVAAVSLLEHGGKGAAPSNKMFEQMLTDYKDSIKRGRAAILALIPTTPEEGNDAAIG